MLARRWNNPIRRVLNLAMYLLLCSMIGTGTVLWLRLPPGSGHERGGLGGGGGSRGEGLTREAEGAGARELMGLTRHEWGDWHLYAGLGLVGLGLVHLWLNRAWLMKVGAQRHSWRLWAGLGVGAAAIAVLAVWPLSG